MNAGFVASVCWPKIRFHDSQKGASSRKPSSPVKSHKNSTCWTCMSADKIDNILIVQIKLLLTLDEARVILIILMNGVHFWMSTELCSRR